MKIGLVGCGRIGSRHLEAYQQIGDVDAIVTDENPELAKQTADQWGGQAVPMNALLEEPLDALDVCVPSFVHKQWIIDGLTAGVHVFCEKPLCLSYGEAVEIRAAALAAKRSVVVGYLYRHHPSFRFARETIAHGIIGEPHFAFARLGGRGSHRTWKHDSTRGGGVIFEMMVHLLDLLSWLLGPLENGKLLHTDLLLPVREIGGDIAEVSAHDSAVLSLSAGGVSAICQSDLATPSFMNYVEVQGSNGSILSSILDYIPNVVYCNEPRALFDRGASFRRFGQVNLFVSELSMFTGLVRSGEIDDWSLLESVELARFIDSIERKAL